MSRVPAVLIKEPGLICGKALLPIWGLVKPEFHVCDPSDAARVNDKEVSLSVVKVNGCLKVLIITQVFKHEVTLVSISVDDAEA